MIRFRFVDDAQKNHSVKRLCEVLELNRSSYYKWKTTSPGCEKLLISDAILGARVTIVFTTARGCYGAKRITTELKDQADHDPVNHKRVARTMRELKLFSYTKKRKVTTTVSKQKCYAPGLMEGRNFIKPTLPVTGINHRWWHNRHWKWCSILLMPPKISQIGQSRTWQP